MPVSLSQLAANTAHVKLSIGEDTVTIFYYPGRITEKSIAQMQGFATMDESTLLSGFASFNETLAHLIQSWDVLDDSVDPPVMFPLEAKRLAELPIGFRLEVITAIMGDIRPEAIAPQAIPSNGKH